MDFVEIPVAFQSFTTTEPLCPINIFFGFTCSWIGCFSTRIRKARKFSPVELLHVLPQFIY